MTGLNVDDKRIGDAVYRVSQLPYGEARPLLWRAASILAPALEAMPGLDMKKIAGGDLSSLDGVGLDAIGRAFRIFFDRASEDDLERFTAAFAKQTLVKVDGAKALVPLEQIAELHWPGRYGDWMQWFVFSARVHFGPRSRGSHGGAAESPGIPAR